MVKVLKIVVDDLTHCHPFLREIAFVFALQETHNWKVSEMWVGYVCGWWVDGRTSILCSVSFVRLVVHGKTVREVLQS